MSGKYMVLINDCRQYSEDGWEQCPHIKDIDENTTIGELIEWHDKLYQKEKRSYVDHKLKIDTIKPDFFRQIHIIKKDK